LRMKRTLVPLLCLVLVFCWCLVASAQETLISAQGPLAAKPQGGNAEFTPGEGGGFPNLNKPDPNPFPSAPDPIPPEIIWPPFGGGGLFEDFDEGLYFQRGEEA
jgi:hypothetical protein